MSITLREITQDNWRECARLDPGPAGRAFIPSNLYALAESKFAHTLLPLGIYWESVMVGFVMYNTQPEADGSCRIYTMMVDAKYQGRGYGTAALLQVVERLRQQPQCATVSLEYERANERAVRLYCRIGFGEVAESPTGGVIAHLRLTQRVELPVRADGDRDVQRDLGNQPAHEAQEGGSPPGA